MIHITVVVPIEYLLMDAGAINWLQYLSSITWSTWPFVVLFKDFGGFLTELIELAYLIPNTITKITYHYCIGVLT